LARSEVAWETVELVQDDQAGIDWANDVCYLLNLARIGEVKLWQGHMMKGDVRGNLMHLEYLSYAAVHF
jgi:hypothetical protein